MERYKDYNYDQTKMLPISFDRQILPGSFEYSLSYLIDTELALSALEQHYNNDEDGRLAYELRELRGHEATRSLRVRSCIKSLRKASEPQGQVFH